MDFFFFLCRKLSGGLIALVLGEGDKGKGDILGGPCAICKTF